MFAMRFFLLKFALLMLGTAAAPSLHADMWECDEPGGGKRFTNIKSDAKGCKQLTITPNVVSSPPAGKASSSPTPGDFPKVAPQVQQQRDSDRKKILENELVNEEKNLQAAKRELAEQENTRLGSERNYQRVLDRLEPYQKKVKLHEDNIANLKRELGNIR
jgi:hypothetical protein